jgi:hypothetical protein
MKYILVFSVLLSGCTLPSQPVTRIVIQTPEPQVMEVRTPPFVKAYKVGAYIDPNNSKALHQAHTLFVEEASASWNLSSPAASGAVRGATLLPGDPAVVSTRTQDELVAELNTQKKLTRTVQEQSQRLLEVTQKLTPNTDQVRSEDLDRVSRQLGQIEQRLGQLELTTTNRTATLKTNTIW